MRLRVATYNLQSFPAGVEATAAVLNEQRPDLVLVQECGSKREIARLADAMGLEFASSHRLFGRIRNAILYPSGWWRAAVEVETLSREGRALKRGFIAAHLRHTGVSLGAVSAHLGLVPTERGRHARELTDFLAGAEHPVILGADLNEGPESPASRWISERLYDAHLHGGDGTGYTFPAASPAARIDYLFASAGVRVLRAWVADGPAVTAASDHRPVVADIEVEES